MSANTKYGCDFCNADLTYTGNSVDYRIALISQPLAPWYTEEGLGGGFVADMLIADPLPKPAHFCSIDHLERWLENGRKPAEAPSQDAKEEE